MRMLSIGALKITFFLRLFEYRKSVINQNLKLSFPEKSKQEIRKIKNEFYSYMGQLIAEFIKLFHLKKTFIRQRVKFKNEQDIVNHLKNNKDVIVVLGHYGNWEWALLASSLYFEAEMVGIYKPLNSKFWDKTFLSLRKQFGATLVTMNESIRYLLIKRSKARLIGIIADQTPSADQLNYWQNFLNQKTAVFLGTEKLAQKLNCPVYFAQVNPISRGFYEISFSLITEFPNQHNAGEITNLHTNTLEKVIKQKPAYWLWSHRRWKHQK